MILCTCSTIQEFYRKMSIPASMWALRKTTPGPSYTLAREPVPVPKEDEVKNVCLNYP
jgi:hypothetical protein